MANSVDWENAPSWATHALTTPPGWDGLEGWRGKVIFTQFRSGKHLLSDYERPSSAMMDDDKGWIVLEARNGE